MSFFLIMALLGEGWNKEIASHYHNLLKNQTLGRVELEQLQLKKLKRIVTHAYNHTKFYRNRFDKADINPTEIKSVEDFCRIPPLTREDLGSELDAMIAGNIPKDMIHFDSTGGSTGLATKFARDNRCLDIKKASEYRFNSWTGWQPGEKILYYWPALKDFAKIGQKMSLWKNKLLSRQLQLYAGKLNKDVLAGHLKALLDFQPHLIRAFPNSLQILAEYILDQGVVVKVKRGIITVGEPVTDSQRKLFNKTFCADVFNCYVSRECGNMACECREHSGLHIAEDLLYLEIVNREKNMPGELIITDLENFGMPLIRYRIQDASKWVSGQCLCRKTFLQLGLNAARLTDYLVSPVDGSIISGSAMVHYLLAEGQKVGRFQLIQDRNDHLTIKMTGSLESNKLGIDHIQNTINKLFEGKMAMDFIFVQTIPFLRSGKFRFVDRTFD